MQEKDRVSREARFACSRSGGALLVSPDEPERRMRFGYLDEHGVRYRGVAVTVRDARRLCRALTMPEPASWKAESSDCLVGCSAILEQPGYCGIYFEWQRSAPQRPTASHHVVALAPLEVARLVSILEHLAARLRPSVAPSPRFGL